MIVIYKNNKFFMLYKSKTYITQNISINLKQSKLHKSLFEQSARILYLLKFYAVTFVNKILEILSFFHLCSF